MTPLVPGDSGRAITQPILASPAFSFLIIPAFPGDWEVGAWEQDGISGVQILSSSIFFRASWQEEKISATWKEMLCSGFLSFLSFCKVVLYGILVEFVGSTLYYQGKRRQAGQGWKILTQASTVLATLSADITDPVLQIVKLGLIAILRFVEGSEQPLAEGRGPWKFWPPVQWEDFYGCFPLWHVMFCILWWNHESDICSSRGDRKMWIFWDLLRVWRWDIRSCVPSFRDLPSTYEWNRKRSSSVIPNIPGVE